MLIFLGFTLLTGTLCGLRRASVLLVAIDRNLIVAEEHYLPSKFHDRFATYRSRARKWLHGRQGVSGAGG
jgi:protein-S-isoprenylcysteine O-methyltransferase Ste14